jgi:hypothetical protein
MSIFSNTPSQFSRRRAWVNRNLERCEYFFPAWFLLRIRTQSILEKSKGRVYHWQRDLYACRAKGRKRKGAMSYPKKLKPFLSLRTQAWNWAARQTPLT